MDVLALGLVTGTALLLLWAGATRRQVRRREAGDWEGAAARPELWTSSARCPQCGSGGGLLSVDGDVLWFACLSCGARHRRDTKG